jgi:Rrf2 family nitric oxide-sensitive transcriptional repressor
MRLTDKTDYSLRVLIYLMQKENKATIQEIADYFKISKNHLKVVVNDLARLGLIQTVTGPNGGVSFNQNSSSYLLGELFRKLEDLTLV